MSSARSAERESFPEIDSFEHPLCLVPIDLSTGKLYLTTAPGFRGMVWFDGGPCKFVRDLYFDVERLHQYQVCRLVTLMPGDEILHSGMGDLRCALEQRGIAWTHLPYSPNDVGRDFFRKELAEVSKQIRSDLEAGKAVAVHGDDYSHSALCEQLPLLLKRWDPSLSEARSIAIAGASLAYAHVVRTY